MLFQLIKIQIGVKKNVNSKKSKEILSIPNTKWKLNKNNHWKYIWKLKISKVENRLILSVITQKSKMIINCIIEKNNEIFFTNLVFKTVLVMQKDKVNKVKSQNMKEKNKK
jgi:hypothetical protein